MDASKVLAMATINMFEAKSNLSRLVDDIEQGREREIIIARNGKPAARLVAMDTHDGKRKLRPGLLAGKYPSVTQEKFDADNELIRRLFEGEDE